MSDAGDRLKARFASLRVRVVVPEWKDIVPDDSEGQPAIYSAPFTLADSTKLQKWIEADSPEGFAHVVMAKAQDEAGDRLFDIGDKAVLLQCCEAHIVSRVGRALMASVDIEDAAGN